jgi:nitrite reductase/ring-hydroxylating ferredoxin subunit
MKKLLALCLLACFAVACDDETVNNIYTSPVDFALDLRYEDASLNNPYTVKEFKKGRYEGERIGYGGLLVICTSTTGVNQANLYAYDLACPVEKSSSIKVAFDQPSLKAKCPKCGAVYTIDNGFGTPDSVSSVALQNYKVLSLGNGKYRVVN